MFWRCTFIVGKIPSQLFQTLLNAIIEKKKKKIIENTFLFLLVMQFFSVSYLDDAIATSAKIFFCT